MSFHLRGIVFVAFASFLSLMGTTLRADHLAIVSDGSTLAGSLESTTLINAGDTTGVTFVPADVGDFGTFTTPPPDAPDGTEVINIHPGGDEGQSGFFKVVFTLPASFSDPSISGAANVDDSGNIFLNGTQIGSADEFSNSTFSSSNSSLFLPGANILLIGDVNTGGPSGAAFYADVSFTPVPEPASLSILLIGVSLLFKKR